MVRIDASPLKQTRWRECALRFALGGAITVAAGLIAKSFGPAAGGLFLAFPAIFPASATLVAKHEQEKKAQRGLHGRERGLDAASLDAAGAALGSIGLAAFAAINLALLREGRVAAAFALSIAGWLAGAAGAWLLWKRSHKLPGVFRSRPKEDARTDFEPARRGGESRRAGRSGAHGY